MGEHWTRTPERMRTEGQGTRFCRPVVHGPDRPHKNHQLLHSAIGRKTSFQANSKKFPRAKSQYLYNVHQKENEISSVHGGTLDSYPPSACALRGKVLGFCRPIVHGPDHPHKNHQLLHSAIGRKMVYDHRVLFFTTRILSTVTALLSVVIGQPGMIIATFNIMTNLLLRNLYC